MGARHSRGPVKRGAVYTNPFGGHALERISDDLAIWTLLGERTKNGAAHSVPLSAPARDLLRALLPDDANEAKHALKDRRAAGALTLPAAVSTPLAGWSKAKRTLDKAIRDNRAKGAAIANRRKHPLRSCEGGEVYPPLPTLRFHARWR